MTRNEFTLFRVEFLHNWAEHEQPEDKKTYIWCMVSLIANWENTLTPFPIQVICRTESSGDGPRGSRSRGGCLESDAGG